MKHTLSKKFLIVRDEDGSPVVHAFIDGKEVGTFVLTTREALLLVSDLVDKIQDSVDCV